MSRHPLYPDTQAHILDTGDRLIQHRGFTALGLAELLREAGVPKGSFYHYFKSKEDFGIALLSRYFANYDSQLLLCLGDGAPGNPRQRLLAYFARWVELAECNDHSTTCLAVKLAAEVSDLSEGMREVLDHGMNQVIARLACAIRTGIAEGALAPHEHPEQLAESLYSNWLGMALRSKVARDSAPLRRLLDETAQRLPAPI
ncbi:TetR/AcrR family transcriptional regulator [Craterilacuibacter sp.]|uniref:TetR/AcrR family transcriptional regulator n=1 Tax=Craterilacuibacter sp. TaxID=2870909 RepID=UPI003F3780AD